MCVSVLCIHICVRVLVIIAWESIQLAKVVAGKHLGWERVGTELSSRKSWVANSIEAMSLPVPSSVQFIFLKYSYFAKK